MGFTKPIEQILLSYQGTFIVSKRYYTSEGILWIGLIESCLIAFVVLK